MKYRIGEFASLLGVSAETIRRYEQDGLIEAERSENGYRYYKAADFTLIMRARLMRNLGIPLKDTMSLFKSGIDESRSTYQTRIGEIESEIHLLHCQKENLIKHLNELDECERMLDRFEIRRRPACYTSYHLNYRDGKLQLNFHTRAGTILESSPYVQHFMLIPQSQISAPSPEYKYGICIDEADSHWLSEETLRECEYIPSELCVCTVSKGAGEVREQDITKPASVLDGLLSGGLSYLNSNGLALAGDITGNLLTLRRERANAQRFIHYTRLWFPVSD